jgi:glucan phosphoethanolaminetransferase (alkaline phosphatase superfamily)
MLLLFLILSIFVVKAVSAVGDILLTYLIVVSGIYVSMAYIIVTSVLYKHHLPTDSWIFFSIVAIFIAASSFFGRFMGNWIVAEQFLAMSMVVLFLAALLKFWRTMALTEKKKAKKKAKKVKKFTNKTKKENIKKAKNKSKRKKK